VSERDLTESTSFRERPRLHPGHFALLRGWIQGLELRGLAVRYLFWPDERIDLRDARRILEQILDEVSAIARREGREKEAALLRRQATRIRLPSGPNTDFTAFVAGLGPSAGEFRESELLELYSDHQTQQGPHPGTVAERRRARLVERQLALIKDLEPLATVALGPACPLDVWCPPTLARRFANAGLVLTAELVERVASLPRWWTGLPGVGVAKAARIETFLAPAFEVVREARGRRSGFVSQVPPRPALPRLAVVPLERFALPRALDGREGRFRVPAEHCTLDAGNDLQALRAFLDTFASGHTRRAYRKELERLLLWSVLERKLPLSSLALEDALAYRAFLADPQPASIWCGERSRARMTPAWRPFAGPLSPGSVTYAMTVLTAFYEWLNRVHYLHGNPWAGIGSLRAVLPTDTERSRSALDPDEESAAGDSPLARSLDHETWRHVLAELAVRQEQRPIGRTRRLVFVLRLGYETGMRVSEIVRARRGHLYRLETGPDPHSGWMLRVRGKGNRKRDVPVSGNLVSELCVYLQERGLPGELEAVPRGTYLIGAADDLRYQWRGAITMLGGPLAVPSPGDGVRAETVARDVKTFFGWCAQRLAARGDAARAAQLQRASVHWLRHTHASHALAAGVPLDVARDVLGHASLATTSRYVQTEERRRYREMAKLWDAD